MEPNLIKWLLSGDVAIQYQTHRDLLDAERPDLQNRIAAEGWGKRFLAARNRNGHWGQGFYQPKWISSHYTLLDLKYLNPAQELTQVSETIRMILNNEKSPDGGVNPARSIAQSDVCVNGMFLNYACYFRAAPEALHSVVDFILKMQLRDGGFNCQFNRSGADHSSVHSTLSTMEGIREYMLQGYTYRLQELLKAEAESAEFLLVHKLFRSHRTGELMSPRMLRLSFPFRWYYDILRALDYFRLAQASYDPRMQDALDILKSKRRKDGRWPVQAKHPGQQHFEMEKAGKPSRWNTLRALRVLRHFDQL